MKKNMNKNFELLKTRVIDSLNHTDLEYICYELSKLKEPTVVSGVGGSSVVSEFGSKVITEKNQIISINIEPRNFIYNKLYGFKNVVVCSYSGDNFGVETAFNNNLKHYLLSNNPYEGDVTNLTYNTTIEREYSFISLGATLIPISILLDYYVPIDKTCILDSIKEYKFDFNTDCIYYEIFSGYDTSATSKYLESTLVEAGIGIPVIHDKYAVCHGRTTLATKYNNIAIYLNRNTELDKLLMEELKQYYKEFIVIESIYKDSILADYQMLIEAMYLTKYMAERKDTDLSRVDYSKSVKKLYKYRGEM